MGDESAIEKNGCPPPPLSKNALKKILKKEAAEKKKAARAIARVSRVVLCCEMRHISA
jgi:hypothetical protein